MARPPSRWGGIATVGSSLFTIAYFLAAAGLLRRWLRGRDDPGRAPLEPVTFFRPIKSGEPEIARDLREFLESVEPGDRVLFGASGGRERSLCAELAAGFPRLDIRCPALDDIPAINPKIAKLVQLEHLAGPERWVVLDSDARADRRFLHAFRSEWQASGAAAFSAPYYFERAGGLVSRLDADATELSLWPGVALLRATGRVNFLTGACMAVRGPDLLALGGWRILADVLADDHELGAAVSRAGGRVGISRAAIALAPPSNRISDWALHQHRAFATFRVCNPPGSLGMPLAFGLAASFLSLLARPLSPARWLLHAAVLASRFLAARSLPGPKRGLGTTWVSGLLEPVFWALAWFPLPVRWAGRWIAPKKL